MTFGKRTGRTVLVVEEQDRVRESLVRALVRGGCDAHGLPSGLAALSALIQERERYEMIVISLNLSDISGKELARRSRALASWLHVLFMAGKGTRCRAGSGDRVLRRPFTNRGFLTAVAEILPKP